MPALNGPLLTDAVIIDLLNYEVPQQLILFPHTAEQRKMLAYLNESQTPPRTDMRAAVDILRFHGYKDLDSLKPLFEAAHFQHNTRLAFAPLLASGIVAGMALVAEDIGPHALPVTAALAVGLATVFMAMDTGAPQGAADGGRNVAPGERSLIQRGSDCLQSLQVALAGVPQAQFIPSMALRVPSQDARVKELKNMAELATLGLTGNAFTFVAHLLFRAGEIVHDCVTAPRAAFNQSPSMAATLQRIVFSVPTLLRHATQAIQRQEGRAPNSVHAMVVRAQTYMGATVTAEARQQILHDVTSLIAERGAEIEPPQLRSLLEPFFYVENNNALHQPSAEAKSGITGDEWAILSKACSGLPAGMQYADLQSNFMADMVARIVDQDFGTESQRMAMLRPWLVGLDAQPQPVREVFMTGVERLFGKQYTGKGFCVEFGGHADDAVAAGSLSQQTRDAIAAFQGPTY